MKIEVVTDYAICLDVKLIFLDAENLVFCNRCNFETYSSKGSKFFVYINNHFYKEYILSTHDDILAALEDLKKYFFDHLDQK